MGHKHLELLSMTVVGEIMLKDESVRSNKEIQPGAFVSPRERTGGEWEDTKREKPGAMAFISEFVSC